MEPTAVVPVRGIVIAALVATAPMLPAWAFAPPLVASLVAPVQRAPRIDEAWLRANHLAWTIEHRRYDEIERAAATIGADSPYAAWVPAAIGLAVEQLDATAAAYVAMERCGELRRFQHHIDEVWPAGRAAMKRVACNIGLRCANGNRLVEIAKATAIGDHAGVLARCAAIDGSAPACLVAACRAKELGIAELLAETTSDAAAIHACDEAGVRFVDGHARATDRLQPVDLVRVHPAAPTDRAPP